MPTLEQLDQIHFSVVSTSSLCISAYYTAEVLPIKGSCYAMRKRKVVSVLN
jgi:hypothetical protein